MHLLWGCVTWKSLWTSAINTNFIQILKLNINLNQYVWQQTTTTNTSCFTNKEFGFDCLFRIALLCHLPIMNSLPPSSFTLNLRMTDLPVSPRVCLSSSLIGLWHYAEPWLKKKMQLLTDLLNWTTEKSRHNVSTGVCRIHFSFTLEETSHHVPHSDPAPTAGGGGSILRLNIIVHGNYGYWIL